MGRVHRSSPGAWSCTRGSSGKATRFNGEPRLLAPANAASQPCPWRAGSLAPHLSQAPAAAVAEQWSEERAWAPKPAWESEQDAELDMLSHILPTTYRLRDDPACSPPSVSSLPGGPARSRTPSPGPDDRWLLEEVVISNRYRSGGDVAPHRAKTALQPDGVTCTQTGDEAATHETGPLTPARWATRLDIADLATPAWSNATSSVRFFGPAAEDSVRTSSLLDAHPPASIVQRQQAPGPAAVGRTRTWAEGAGGAGSEEYATLLAESLQLADLLNLPRPRQAFSELGR